MTRYLTRILICTVPVLIGIAIITWATNSYVHGEGGFKLGVDLAGGTILVYEVDTSKMQGGKAAWNADKAAEMTAALKRRIDPNDLFNVTIRTLPGDPPRVEIVLPTGGTHQSEIEDKAWRNLLDEVAKKYPPPEGQSYADVGTLRVPDLVDRVIKFHSDVTDKDVEQFITDTYRGPKGKRGLTNEGIEKIKTLISQQGNLEFRILANTTDDHQAIDIATNYIADKKNKEELDRASREGLPPPGPTLPDGSPFQVTVNGETTYHRYSWVEIGKNELYTLNLESNAVKHAEESSNEKIRARVPYIKSLNRGGCPRPRGRGRLSIGRKPPLQPENLGCDPVAPVRRGPKEQAL